MATDSKIVAQLTLLFSADSIKAGKGAHLQVMKRTFSQEGLEGFANKLVITSENAEFYRKMFLDLFDPKPESYYNQQGHADKIMAELAKLNVPVAPPTAPPPAPDKKVKVVSRPCPKCKATVPVEMDFCGKCGTKADQEPSPSNPPKNEEKVKIIIRECCGVKIPKGKDSCGKCGKKVV